MENHPKPSRQARTQPPLTEGTGRFRLRITLAPLCLCVVALLHLYRVQWNQQTPWKGGGFAMFSTVDARAARYLKLYLVTETDLIPVAVPSTLRKRANQLRAAPSETKLRDFATRLLELKWYNQRLHREAIAQRLLETDSNHVDPLLLTNSSSSPQNVSSQFQGPDFRAISPQDDNARHFQPLETQGVRVELWRYQFVSRHASLHGRKHLEIEIARTKSTP